MIHDEEQQVGTDGQGAGLDLAGLALLTRFRHAGGVGQLDQ